MNPNLQHIKDFLAKLNLPCLLIDQSNNILYSSTSLGNGKEPDILRSYQPLLDNLVKKLDDDGLLKDKKDTSFTFEVDPDKFGIGPFINCHFVPIRGSDDNTYFLLFFSDATCITLLDHLPIVSLYSPTHDILNIKFATSGLEKWTGLSLEKFLEDRDTFRLLIHPEDRARVCSFLENVGTNPSEGDIEISYRLTHTDGSYRWVEHKIIFTDETADNGSCFSMLRDITTQKELEFALSKAEERCRLFFEKGPLGFLCINKNGIIVDCNNRLAELIGVSRDELIGLNSLSSANPTFRDWAREVLRGKEIKFSGKYVAESTQKQLFISLIGFPLKNDDGVVIGAYALIEDLSSKQELEQKLIEQRDFNKLIIETAEVLVAEILMDGTIFNVNTVFANMLGKSQKELIGMSFSSLLHFWEDELEKLMSGANRDSDGRFEAYISDGKGRKRLISWKISPYLSSSEGGETHFLVVGTDITSQRQLREKLREVQKMEAIGRLAGGVAHDFNNQLTAIMGYCQMLLMEMDPKSDSYRKLKIINKAAKRAAETTNQLLAFSRKQTLKPERISLNKSVKEACNFFRRLLGEEIMVEFNPGQEDCTIEVDPGRFLQIFLNLALNSRDALNGKGKIVVTTTVSRNKKALQRLKDDVDKVAIITFEDDGAGMEKEVLERAFEPFFTTKPLGQGTGLGLAMIYGTVKQSRGDITLESAPGKGTKVSIFLPAIESKDRYKTSIKRLGLDKQLGGRGKLVFLLEDEPIVRSTMIDYLKKLDFSVRHFSNPNELESFLSDYNGPEPAIFITDVVMPGKDGLEMAQAVKERFPNIKIVFMSGYSEQVLEKKGHILNVGMFLQKPFTIRELEEVLYHLIK